MNAPTVRKFEKKPSCLSVNNDSHAAIVRWLGNLLDSVLPTLDSARKNWLASRLSDLQDQECVRGFSELLARAFLEKALDAAESHVFYPSNARFITDGSCSRLSELAEILELNDVSKSILLLTYHIHTEELFQQTVRIIQRASNFDSITLLAMMLSDSAHVVRAQLASGSSLMESCAICLASPGVTLEAMLVPQIWVMAVAHDVRVPLHSLKQQFFLEGISAEYGRADFLNLAEEVTIVSKLLRGALVTRESGVNILIHGQESSGKSSLAKMLVEDSGAAWREVCAPLFQDQPEVMSKLASIVGYDIAQRSSCDGAAVVIHDFDAIMCSVINADKDNELFPWFGCHFGRRRDVSKSLLDQWLESTLSGNPRPTIWLMRDASLLPETLLSMFTWRIAMPRLPAEKSICSYDEGFPKEIANQVISHCVRADAYSPAFLRSTARALSLAGVRDIGLAENMVVRSIKSLKSIADDASPMSSKGYGKAEFCENFTNVKGNMPVSRIVEALRRNPRQTICLYGPPGTGKTEFVTHLASVLGRPLLLKRCSDILDKYVGEAEKRVKYIFTEASVKNAVLFLDEADALLSDRLDSTNSAMRTTTNEILKSMEFFEGVFVCATNLFEQLDPAALRRFSLKIGFDYPTLEQRWELFCRDAEISAAEIDITNFRTRLAALKLLTPGDFATVRRQRELFGDTSAEFFLTQLEEEHRLKSGKSGMQSIGFIM